jgi:integrase
MLYGCGLRISEALNLKIKNVDTVSGKIIIDIAKNDKQRIVMMSESLKNICQEYKNKYLYSLDNNGTFFQHNDGTIRSKTQVNNFFRNILYKSDIPYLGRGKGPYLHNLRHTFACHAFYQMHINGIDMNVGIALMSTYLGHESTKTTEKYLRLTQEIFPTIVQKISNYSSDIYIKIDYEQ